MSEKEKKESKRTPSSSRMDTKDKITDKKENKEKSEKRDPPNLDELEKEVKKTQKKIER